MDLPPDGFGTLYSDSGKAIYAGNFDQGTLGGAWMLSLAVQDLRVLTKTGSDSAASQSETDRMLGLKPDVQDDQKRITTSTVK